MSKNQPKEKTPEEILESVPPKIEKAFSLERIEGGWSFITYIIEDGVIKDVKRTEPELKSIAIEQFKIAAFKYWTENG